MPHDYMKDLLPMISNITSSLSKISIHLEEIVEKLDNINENTFYIGEALSEDITNNN